jgi:hypothetical protein
LFVRMRHACQCVLPCKEQQSWLSISFLHVLARDLENLVNGGPEMISRGQFIFRLILLPFFVWFYILVYASIALDVRGIMKTFFGGRRQAPEDRKQFLKLEQEFP